MGTIPTSQFDIKWLTVDAPSLSLFLSTSHSCFISLVRIRTKNNLFHAPCMLCYVLYGLELSKGDSGHKEQERGLSAYLHVIKNRMGVLLHPKTYKRYNVNKQCQKRASAITRVALDNIRF